MRRHARATERAVEAMQKCAAWRCHFPAASWSGSKTRSRYKFLIGLHQRCLLPTLRGIVESALPEGVNSVLEIVIDGLDLPSVEESTRVGIRAPAFPASGASRRVTMAAHWAIPDPPAQGVSLTDGHLPKTCAARGTG